MVLKGIFKDMQGLGGKKNVNGQRFFFLRMEHVGGVRIYAHIWESYFVPVPY